MIREIEFIGPMMVNEAWRIGSEDSEILMHRWACIDGRYSWGLRGPCPCGEHEIDEFWVTTEADPEVAQPRLVGDANLAHWCHQLDKKEHADAV